MPYTRSSQQTTPCFGDHFAQNRIQQKNISRTHKQKYTHYVHIHKDIHMTLTVELGKEIISGDVVNSFCDTMTP